MYIARNKTVHYMRPFPIISEKGTYFCIITKLFEMDSCSASPLRSKAIATLYHFDYMHYNLMQTSNVSIYVYIIKNSSVKFTV